MPARLAVQHVLEQPAGGPRDHRAAGGLGLHGGDPELLAGGDDQRAAAGEQPRGLIV